MAVDPHAASASHEVVQQGMDIFNSAYFQSQVFWTGVAFFIMLAVLWWKVVPTITKMLDERALQIKADLDRAEAAKADAEASLAKYEAQLAKAKGEAADVVNAARTDAKEMIDAKLKEADAEIARKKEDAQTSIAAAKAQAMEELEGTVAKLAVKVSEALLKETVDAKKAEKLTDDAIKTLN